MRLATHCMSCSGGCGLSSLSLSLPSHLCLFVAHLNTLQELNGVHAPSTPRPPNHHRIHGETSQARRWLNGQATQPSHTVVQLPQTVPSAPPGSTIPSGYDVPPGLRPPSAPSPPPRFAPPLQIRTAVRQRGMVSFTCKNKCRFEHMHHEANPQATGAPRGLARCPARTWR